VIDHFGIRCRNSAVSLPFYRACLEPLGIRLVQERPEFKANIFMQEGSPTFLFIGEGEPEWLAQVGEFKLHLGFRARAPAEVDGFYEAAIRMGGIDNGPPGYRRPTCYSAFVFDPDGHNIEAIFQTERPFP